MSNNNTENVENTVEYLQDNISSIEEHSTNHNNISRAVEGLGKVRDLFDAGLIDIEDYNKILRNLSNRINDFQQNRSNVNIDS